MAAAAPAQSQIAKLWNHPAGPKTIFFWAPLMKWVRRVAKLYYHGLREIADGVHCVSGLANCSGRVDIGAGHRRTGGSAETC
jgi:hypothetical protein